MIYNYSAPASSGNIISLRDYEGKVVLIVNTATGCGFTPQYEGLQKLYEKYRERGFEILDFPCNQFLEQAPGTDEEINEFCQTRYHTTFQRFAKVYVNGPETLPLYKYLKEAQPKDIENEETPGLNEKLQELGQQRRQPSDILWNFTKFLIDRDGAAIARYAPTWSPESLAPAIVDLL